MYLKCLEINEKICGYSIAITFFFILISTAVVNIGILLSIITGLILIAKKKKYLEVFFYNKINLSLVFLLLIFILSYTYSIASFEEAISSFKKYIKFIYIPICYFVFKIDWIREKALNYFIIGSTIILFFSYMKYFHIVNPLDIKILSNIFGASFNSYYNNNLLSGATIFQNSIIHGVVFSFYSFLLFLKGKNQGHSAYYLLSFLSFYNIIFMNISRTAYIITFLLFLLIILRFYINKDYKRTFIILLCMSFILIIGNKDTIIDRYTNAKNDLVSIQEKHYSTSFGLRYIYFVNGINNMTTSPLLGHGIGSYKKTIENYFKKNGLNMNNYITQNPHNEFISISTQTGIIGLLLFFSFIYLIIKDFFYSDIGKSVIVIILVSCTFNSLFFDNIMGIFAVLITSLAMQKNYLTLN